MAEVFSDQNTASIESRRAKVCLLKNRSTSVKDCLPHKMQHAVLPAGEKGASSWLTALPLVDFGFLLSKSDFRDALHLRYGCTPPRLPTACVCCQPFHIDHALSCSLGGTWDSGTTRYGTCLGKYWKILVLTSASSRPWGSLKVRSSLRRQTALKTPGWISRLVVSGEQAGMNVHILMLGSFTPMHVPTATARCRRSIGPRKWRSAGNIKKEFWTSMEEHLHLWFFSVMGGAGPVEVLFWSAWQTRLQRRSRPHTPKP